MIYPWQENVWQRLMTARTAERLPHALLLCGPAGSGKGHFAETFAAALLCTELGEAGYPCGLCRACGLLKAETHPDLTNVVPEKEGAAIKIDQIRTLNEKIGLHSHLGGYKVLLIDPADAMNISAANSLLKSLEEPPSNTVFVLACTQPGRLVATIRSRCQQFNFQPAKDPAAIDWLRSELPAGRDAEVLLALADGGPLRALALAESGRDEIREQLLQGLMDLSGGRATPLATAEQWLGFGAAEVFGWLIKLTADLCVLGASGDARFIVNRDLAEQLQVLIKGLDLRRLFSVYQNLLEFRQHLMNSSGLRELELLEEIAIKWTQEVSPPEASICERTAS